MSIQAIQPIMPQVHGASNIAQMPSFGALQQVQVPQEDRLAFETILDAYMSMVGSAGRAEAHAQHLAIEHALGNHDDMLSVILAQEMAYTSINFAIQVTSRIIESYREIMRMQI